MILVTGGTGLAGHFVVHELMRRHHTVRVLARPASLAKLADLGIDVVPGDLADPDSLRRATQGVTGIVHAACTFTDAAVDIAAMQILLDGWQQGPFVFVSSLDVYGLAGPAPVSEEHPLSETYSDYGRGKVVCERLLEARAQESGRSDYAILRAAYIWGPHPTAYARLVDARLRQGEPIVLPGADAAEWSQYRDAWIDARDLAWIAAECLERPPGEALNALSGHFTWHELCAELIHLTGSASQIVHKPLGAISAIELPHEQLYAQTWRFSDARLQKRLGFQPRCSLSETLQETLLQA